MKNKNIIFIAFLAILGLSSCKKTTENLTEQIPLVTVKTTQITQGKIENQIELNGKTIYLQNNKILSPIAGYIAKVNVKLGDKIKKDEILFEIQTKENKALEQTDVFKKEQGIIKVHALSDGVINELNIYENGVYVLEGDVLCNIIENSNLIVQVNVPFEYNKILKYNTECEIQLPDQTTFKGMLYKILPTISESDQTQTVWIKPIQGSSFITKLLPENLNLIVKFPWNKQNNALLVSKIAVMSNETQSEFWVMKLIDQKVAIKVPIQKGIENNNLVEISSPALKKNDIVVSEGAYGLIDSTLVKVDN